MPKCRCQPSSSGNNNVLLSKHINLIDNSTSVQANWPITGHLPFFVKQKFDLKFISRVNMADIRSIFDLVSQKFCIRELNSLQKEAIIQFVGKQRDVFINLPTGFGKSLIYQALPLVFDAMHGEGHIVVVVLLPSLTNVAIG